MDVVQEALALRKLKIVEKAPTIDINHFPQPHVNMVTLNWPEKEKRKLTVESYQRNYNHIKSNYCI